MCLNIVFPAPPGKAITKKGGSAKTARRANMLATKEVNRVRPVTWANMLATEEVYRVSPVSWANTPRAPQQAHAKIVNRADTKTRTRTHKISAKFAVLANTPRAPPQAHAKIVNRADTKTKTRTHTTSAKFAVLANTQAGRKANPVKHASTVNMLPSRRASSAAHATQAKAPRVLLNHAQTAPRATTNKTPHPQAMAATTAQPAFPSR